MLWTGALSTAPWWNKLGIENLSPPRVVVAEVVSTVTASAIPPNDPTATPTATATPPATPTTRSNPTHVVQPGDTLYSIAGRYGLSPEELIVANHLQNPNAIYVGQALTIPFTPTPSPTPTTAPPSATPTKGPPTATPHASDTTLVTTPTPWPTPTGVVAGYAPWPFGPSPAIQPLPLSKNLDHGTPVGHRRRHHLLAHRYDPAAHHQPRHTSSRSPFHPTRSLGLPFPVMARSASTPWTSEGHQPSIQAAGRHC